MVTCTLSNINILRSCTVRVTIFSMYWQEILPCFDFYVVTHALALAARSYALFLTWKRLRKMSDFVSNCSGLIFRV